MWRVNQLLLKQKRNYNHDITEVLTNATIVIILHHIHIKPIHYTLQTYKTLHVNYISVYNF